MNTSGGSAEWQRAVSGLYHLAGEERETLILTGVIVALMRELTIQPLGLPTTKENPSFYSYLKTYLVCFWY